MPVVEALSQHPKAWVDFMMRYELGLEEPDPKRALTSAATIAGSYVAGGFIPLVAVHGAVERGAWTTFRSGDAGGAWNLWLHERALYRHRSASQRVTDNGDRRPCGGGRICACQTDFVTVVT